MGRGGHTASAIIELTEEITNAMDESKYTIGVFIDLKKAFDTINHKILIQKLNHYGVRGFAADWVKSYLEDRKQLVVVDGVQSMSKSIRCGVPQGSILGPTLFLLYINDICNISEVLRCILYADDTSIFCSGEDILELCNRLTNELEKLHIWLIINKLSLNIGKTNFMIFSGMNIKEDVGIKIDGVNIDRVYHTKFIGVEIDCKLRWREHVNNIQTKIAKNISVLYKMKFLLDSAVLFTLYQTIILPYLTYCSEIWGNTYRTTINGLFLLQKRAVRIVYKAEYWSHTKPIFYELKTLNIFDIIEHKTALLMYKAYHRLLPDSIWKYFTNVTHSYSRMPDVS